LSETGPESNESWLSLLSRGGDRDLASGMRRLARLAAEAHRHEAAKQAASDEPSRPSTAHQSAGLTVSAADEESR